MKHQQVVVDYWTMVKTSCTCLLLALSGYVLIKMVQTVFWLPRYLQNNQKQLEALAAQCSVDLNADGEKEKDMKADNSAEKGSQKEGPSETSPAEAKAAAAAAAESIPDETKKEK